MQARRMAIKAAASGFKAKLDETTAFWVDEKKEKGEV
jgi:hypothetical protein